MSSLVQEILKVVSLLWAPLVASSTYDLEVVKRGYREGEDD
jgi:hypothetical protein